MFKGYQLARKVYVVNVFVVLNLIFKRKTFDKITS